MKSVEERLVEDFEKKVTQFENFSEKMNILLKELLEQNKITYHSIAKRVKERDSLVKKIRNKNKYQNLDEITDIVGCRIITYFEDDVEKIVNIIKEEFLIDEKNSTDKKKILDPDKFGYLSYHIVCSVNSGRAKLVEYKNYKDIKFEIQIRTILQHAWAEIEHDIGYKSSVEVPRDLRRKFSRIAGMLEIADDEFSRLKRDINAYVEEIEQSGIEDTDINAESLRIFLDKSKALRQMRGFIKERTNSPEIELAQNLQSDAIYFILKLLYRFTNLKRIKELENAITSEKKNLQEFTSRWISKNPNNGTIYYGLVILYYILFYNIKTKNVEAVVHLFRILKNSSNIQRDVELAFLMFDEVTKA